MCYHFDNMVVVASLQKRTAKSISHVHFLRGLFLYGELYSFQLSAAHESGSSQYCGGCFL